FLICSPLLTLASSSAFSPLSLHDALPICVLGPDRDGRFEGGEAPDLDQFVAARPLLAEQLEAQAQLLLRTPGDRLIARSSWAWRSEEHTSELQSRENLVCRLLLEKKKTKH